MPSSMFTSMICAPLSDLLARYRDGRRVVIGFDQTPEDRRTRDVASLAHIDEQVVRPDVAVARDRTRRQRTGTSRNRRRGSRRGSA